LNTSQDSEYNSLKLEDLFSAFFIDELRDLVCDNCHQEDGKVKLSKCISSIPTTLVIHLKRFRFDPDLNEFAKLNNSVIFPAYFNLQDCEDVLSSCPRFSSCYPFMWEQQPKEISMNPSDFISMFNLNDKVEFTTKKFDQNINNRSKFDYKLSAVVRHLGNDLLSGHYICDVSPPASIQSDENMWTRFDDSFVRKIPEVCLFVS
jgi:ubiquitin C-terminal hydrolase